MSRISDRETAILGLLCQKSQYGYELEKTIEERGMRTWTTIGFSSIYYVLKKLEEKGLIESTIKDMEGNPPRKIYSVTESGSSVLKEKLKKLLSQNKKSISPFDLGIAYHFLLDPEEVIACLTLYLASLDKREALLRQKMKENENRGVPYRVIALFSRPLALIEAERKWVTSFIKNKEKWRNDYGKTDP
ncbi:MAG: PadR family transcriptional regulator [Candidatus Thorarchaeota archaeon]|jgi:DNA-binding PadR family transcriptional regulator